MKKILVSFLGFLVAGIVMAYTAYPTEILNKSLTPSTNIDQDMFYHGTPTYYWTFTNSNYILASYFEPSTKYNIHVNFRIKYIGFMGYVANGPADVYIFLEETGGHPDCTPQDFSKKKYGPFSGHINNSYPDYDNLNIYYLNWYIKKSEIYVQPYHRFWVLYHLKTPSPPYPISDESTDPKDSYTYDSSRWTTILGRYKPCWCMHLKVEYPPSSIDNTSLGQVKSLFR